MNYIARTGKHMGAHLIRSRINRMMVHVQSYYYNRDSKHMFIRLLVAPDL